MRAFLGTGLLGSNFTKALRRKGEEVQVWNRTPAKAKALEEVGAKSFNTPAEAVSRASIIHLTLKDDASVDEVLEKAAPGLMPGAIIIDHTTTSAEGAANRSRQWKQKGFSYQHAPVFMGPGNALDSSGYMLVSGDQTLISSLSPILSAMTGQLINLGDEAGKAAKLKLIGNLFLISLTAGISDTLALAKASGLAVSDLSALFDVFNPGASMPARLKRIVTGKFNEPSWELVMARKDAGLMMEAAKKTGTTLHYIPTIAAEMDRWIEKGHGNDDWSIIAKDSLPGKG